jgi:hypothetical protein
LRTARCMMNPLRQTTSPFLLAVRQKFLAAETLYVGQKRPVNLPVGFIYFYSGRCHHFLLRPAVSC